jgi:glycosyltransferase involved in cell wall biosynthesis
MRVLILGPGHAGGSLPPYLHTLAAGLRHHGITVHRHGSSQIPYDQQEQRFWPLRRVLDAAGALADGIDPAAYDLVSLHFGNLELEQLVLPHWAQRDRPPVVYHVHTLAPTMFRDHLPDPVWDAAVRRGIQTADGYVYFGQYARERLAGTITERQPYAVAWLPTTIPRGTAGESRAAMAAALDVPPAIPIISLYGYAAPWKDATLLIDAVRRMKVAARVVLAGDFWDDPTQAGIDLAHATSPIKVGAAELVVVPGYLDATDRAALIHASSAGVFPYQHHPSFQGSGAIADYLAQSVPVVATDVANMAELVGETGHVVPVGDPVALAVALDSVASDTTAAAPDSGRAAHTRRFTAEAHAARCLALYRQVLQTRTRA